MAKVNYRAMETNMCKYICDDSVCVYFCFANACFFILSILARVDEENKRQNVVSPNEF